MKQVPFPSRRIVTGHNEAGKAVVLHDGVPENTKSRRPGATTCVLWSTDGYPVDNSESDDAGRREVPIALPNGTVFRILKMDPNYEPHMHRTDSIDYGIVLSGSCDMQLDDGVEVRVNEGDVIVQRGTNHMWVNRSEAPCIIAFVMVGAKPAVASASEGG